MRSGVLRRPVRRSRPPARCRRARRRPVSNRPSALAAPAAWPAATSPHLRLPRVSMLSATCACIGAAPSASAAATPETACSGCQAIGRSASQMPSTARARSDQRAATASPRKRTSPGASTGWSFIFGKMPKRVLARHVLGGEDRRQPRRASLHRVEIAEREARAGMRRAHDPHPQRIGRRLVGAEAIGACHLRPAVDALEASADGAHSSWVKRCAVPTPWLAGCVGSSPA